MWRRLGQAEFVPDSTVGSSGDNTAPTRAGCLAMGSVIDLDLFDPNRPAPGVPGPGPRRVRGERGGGAVVCRSGSLPRTRPHGPPVQPKTIAGT
jgi:hypothetical protein